MHALQRGKDYIQLAYQPFVHIVANRAILFPRVLENTHYQTHSLLRLYVVQFTVCTKYKFVPNEPRDQTRFPSGHHHRYFNLHMHTLHYMSIPGSLPGSHPAMHCIHTKPVLYMHTYIVLLRIHSSRSRE